MTAPSAKTIRILDQFDDIVKGTTIDLSKTYTTEFAINAKWPVPPWRWDSPISARRGLPGSFHHPGCRARR